MIGTRVVGGFVFLVLAILRSGFAQHDPQRNAVRHIAAGAFGKATAELKKADDADSETQFVRMLGSLRQGNVETAVRHADAALKAGLPFGRLVAGPRDALEPLYGTRDYGLWKQKHADLRLLHGPMLGAVTDDAASFWIRTVEESRVTIRVLDDQEKTFVEGHGKTTAASDFTGVVSVKGLSPDTEYRYQVLIDGELVRVENARFRTYPDRNKPAKFKVGFGGGAGFVPKWESMWDTIAQKRPHAFFMLGDNVYIDDPEQPLTQLYCYYRRQSRPEWQRFVSQTAMYSIYDDHDFGTNDCIPGPDIEKPKWKRNVWNRFRQNWVNPFYGGGEKQPGCWSDFHIGDVHFILLDGRYYRNRKGRPSMLGPVQKKWLFETLKNSKGTFKVLASPVPWTAGVKPGSNDTWDGFSDEREEIFSFLEENRINGVILIAADRHRSDLRVTKRPDGYDLFEFESSRLTNRHTHKVVQTDGLIWGYNKTCSFALMSFDTSRDDPQVRFEVVTIDAETVHSYDLPLSRLTHQAGR